MPRSRALLCLPLLLAATPVWGHYLWVGINPKDNTANVYFEEGPAARDGKYLDPFVSGGKTWIRTLSQPEATPLEVSDTKQGDKRWLSGSLTADAPRSVDSYGKFGTYSYGKTEVLLHYYAKYLDVATTEQMEKLARAEQLKLDILPRADGDSIRLQVLWQGEPAPAERPMYIRGPGGFRQTLKTDQNGQVSFSPKAQGQYLMRTSVQLDESGTDDGKPYEQIRHHSTLTMQLPVK